MADVADDKQETPDPQELLAELTAPIDATMSLNSSFVDYQAELKGPRTLRVAIELAEGERWDPETRRVITPIREDDDFLNDDRPLTREDLA